MFETRRNRDELVVNFGVLPKFVAQNAKIDGFMISPTFLTLGSFTHEFILFWLHCDLRRVSLRVCYSLTLKTAVWLGIEDTNE